MYNVVNLYFLKLYQPEINIIFRMYFVYKKWNCSYLFFHLSQTNSFWIVYCANFARINVRHNREFLNIKIHLLMVVYMKKI